MQFANFWAFLISDLNLYDSKYNLGSRRWGRIERRVHEGIVKQWEMKIPRKARWMNYLCLFFFPFCFHFLEIVIFRNSNFYIPPSWHFFVSALIVWSSPGRRNLSESGSILRAKLKNSSLMKLFMEVGFPQPLCLFSFFSFSLVSFC